MGFGLTKEKQSAGLSKRVFDDFDGVIVDARWRESKAFTSNEGTRESGPQLEVVIQNCIYDPEKVQRNWYKLGSKFVGDISEDGMIMTSDMQMNANAGLAVLCNQLTEQGVDFSDERFGTEEGGVNAAGFVGIKAHWKWSEITTKIGDTSTTYDRLDVTKFYGFTDLDEFFTSQVAQANNGNVNLETAIELIKVYCMDTPRTHTEILSYVKKQPELADDAEVVAKVKDGNYLESIGLSKRGSKFQYS